MEQKNFIDYLVRNLELALKYSVLLRFKKELLNVKPVTVTNMLVYFTNDFSTAQYDDILRCMKQNWNKFNINGVSRLLQSLATRDYKHVIILEMICTFFNTHLNEFKGTIESIENAFTFKILKALNKLNHFNSKTLEILIELTLKDLSKNKFQKSHVVATNLLLDSCIKFNNFKNLKLVDYFLSNFVDVEGSCVTECDGESLNYHDFLYYSALIKCNDK